MMRCRIVFCVALYLPACSTEPAQSIEQQAFMQNQGTQLQGMQLQGAFQGVVMQGFQFAGATRNGGALANVRIERGELVAEQDQATLHGADLIGSHLLAVVGSPAGSPPASAVVEYRITDVEPEDPGYDPTHTGSSFLYTLEQNVDGAGAWQPACGVDNDARQVAIPLTATWDARGNRVESSALFTFGCTSGVIAKCYRWGYRPWLTGFGDVVALHWTCTRLARADYCGNGVSHTRDGTVINLWDNAPAPGPIERRGQPSLGMLFEAGWSTSGAVCLSHARWLLGGPIIVLGCPDRLLAPGLGLLGAVLCDLPAQVLGQAGNARMFDESYLSVNLDLL